ncbi:large ribosomal subunit protein mL42 [Drosophila kikkawai]|uniref:Large ribosomal subunit protein mL42 n=1 Tax=Drosophila kikkawai TaxID=30033 RepID=A0A6P4IC10_DROKI|nr:39S ribosomal protein L42, mitochondrial [Drosophila kikkawai]
MSAARLYTGFRLFSSNPVGGQRLVEAVAVTKNGRTIVAWHPEPSFPYENTRPLPKIAEAQSSSVVKETALNSAMRAFKSKHPEVARQELMQLTHTTKHRWFPRARDNKAKKTPMDRPYL